ncbi:MAG: flavin reductase [Faecalibacterium sp.]|nr:flavin reductase [Faecalibacterium sp.]
MDLKVLRNLSYGVYLVTALDGMRPCGCVANSIMQISSRPATVAVSINKENYTHSLISRHGYFAVTLLAQDTDPGLIGTFGFQSARTANKFDGLDFTFEEGAPVPANVGCGWFSCQVTGSYDAGTHTVFFARVTDGAPRPGEPMTYSYYHKVIKGKSPKAAPTYQPEEEPAPAGKVWKCGICGYIYEGDTPFEQLPDSYTCPLCRQPKTVFKAE